MMRPLPLIGLVVLTGAGLFVTFLILLSSVNTTTTRPADAGTPTTSTDPARPPHPTGTNLDAARGQPEPLPAAEQFDAGAVAETAVLASHNFDTRTDTSPRDAHQRASYLYTDDLTARTTVALPGGPGADWLAWENGDAYLTAEIQRVEEDILPTGSPTEAHRAYQVVQTVHTDTTDSQQTPVVVYVTLTRPTVDDPWRVDAFHTNTHLEW